MQKYIGTAGWSMPRNFFVDGLSAHLSGLQKYSKIFNCVEINSSFYRNHLVKTYVHWKESVPEDFRFSIKLLKTITHERRLKNVGPQLDEVFPAILTLENKLGCLLVQIPPSLHFQKTLVGDFFSELRSRYKGMIAFEARHRSWNSKEVSDLYRKYKIDRVFADPLLFEDDELERPPQYFRLHGSPIIYRSGYTDSQLKNFSKLFKEADILRPTWCIFDNTMLGLATFDAVKLRAILEPKLNSFSAVGANTLSMR